MAIKYANNLAWQKERVERHLLIIEVEVDNLTTYYNERHSFQDDEDDTLAEVANLLAFASEQIEEARRVLEEGV